MVNQENCQRDKVAGCSAVQCSALRGDAAQCNAMRGMRRTLGLLKDTLLDTSSYRLVEERVEHVVGDRDRVVRTDVLLQLLTAAPRVSKS